MGLRRRETVKEPSIDEPMQTWSRTERNDHGENDASAQKGPEWDEADGAPSIASCNTNTSHVTRNNATQNHSPARNRRVYVYDNYHQDEDTESTRSFDDVPKRATCHPSFPKQCSESNDDDWHSTSNSQTDSPGMASTSTCVNAHPQHNDPEDLSQVMMQHSQVKGMHKSKSMSHLPSTVNLARSRSELSLSQYFVQELNLEAFSNLGRILRSMVADFVAVLSYLMAQPAKDSSSSVRRRNSIVSYSRGQQQKINEDALETLYRSPHSIRSNVYNFLRIPFALEKFISYALLLCLDCFLYFGSTLFLRVGALFVRIFVLSFIWILYVIGNVIIYLVKLVVRRPSRKGRTRRVSVIPRPPSFLLKIQDLCDLLRLFTLLMTLFILMPQFNYSFLYHYIRGQSTLKLYVTYNMLELFDKMASAFGIDMQDAMYYLVTKLYFERGKMDRNKEEKPRSRFHAVKDAVLSIVGYLVYLFLHTTILYIRIISLNVALNSSNNALFTLLVSNNFLELKKPIFKRFAKENIFQFSYHDATERFQLIVFGLIICMQNSRHSAFTGTEVWDIMYCLLAEVVVDFLKHAFIAKFNAISSSVYSRFLDKLCEDVTEDRLQDTFLDNMNITSRRLGFTPIPLVTVVFYVAFLYFQSWMNNSTWYTWIFFAHLLLTLLMAKFLVNILTVGYASRRRFKVLSRKNRKMTRRTLNSATKDVPREAGSVMSQGTEDSSMQDDNSDINLTKIYRYELFGKRLPE